MGGRVEKFFDRSATTQKLSTALQGLYAIRERRQALANTLVNPADFGIRPDGSFYEEPSETQSINHL